MLINRKIALALILLFGSSAYADETPKKLEGKVESSALQKRLLRPAMPQRAATQVNKPAVESSAASGRFDFKLNAADADSDWSLYSNKNGKKIDIASLKQEEQPGKKPCDCLKSIDLPLKEDLGGRIIDWEPWHKRFVESFYDRFHHENSGHAVGSCRILIMLNREGDLSFLSGADFKRQSPEFQDVIMRSVEAMAHSAELAFPEGSRRQSLQFSMLLTAHRGNRASSYGWKLDDQERY
ncbi:MAG: hypothetical protein K2X27_15690 [Candidatus Obscuribacterales bacterium]|nr:hypothetical protein [Candidatus Obscuribacterales bacterium]